MPNEISQIKLPDPPIASLPDGEEVDPAQLRTRLVVGETASGYMTIEFEGLKCVTRDIDEDLAEKQLRALLWVICGLWLDKKD